MITPTVFLTCVVMAVVIGYVLGYVQARKDSR